MNLLIDEVKPRPLYSKTSNRVVGTKHKPNIQLFFMIIHIYCCHLSASSFHTCTHLQLQGSHVQSDPHLQPLSSAPTPISAPSNEAFTGATPMIRVSVVDFSAKLKSEYLLHLRHKKKSFNQHTHVL